MSKHMEGLCDWCKIPVEEINPRTNKPYRYCKEHRDILNAQQRKIRRYRSNHATMKCGDCGGPLGTGMSEICTECLSKKEMKQSLSESHAEWGDEFFSGRNSCICPKCKKNRCMKGSSVCLDCKLKHDMDKLKEGLNPVEKKGKPFDNRLNKVYGIRH